MSQQISRRQWLGGVAAAGAAVTIVPRHVLGGANQTAPSEKLALAGIGVGGIGFGQLQACEGAGFQIVALCDVDDVYAKKAYDRWPQAKRFRDYREMYEAIDSEIDAVYCGTPDHTHAVIVLPALRRKKHVCCVKPITRTIRECRTLVDTAREAGVATTDTSSPNTSEAACRTCELIWAGAIGPVREVHMWSDRPWWPQGMTRPAGEDAVPETLDWDLWIGPAAMRPFKEAWPDGHLALEQGLRRFRNAVYHPWNFRGWWDFGTGSLGDMGCHHANTPFRALKLTHPVGVSASSSKVMPETAPLASIVTYEFPARDDMPPVRVVWYDGGLKPLSPRPGFPLGGSGEMYIGDDGFMIGPNVFPEERAKKFADVPRTLPRRPGIYAEWIEACRGGEPAGTHFPTAGLLAEFVLLGNIAIRTGKQLEWDGPAGRFTNDEAANGMIHNEYREGWSLEA
ncbi:MAG: Gfo/Idh/MocA family oxidoreductase [Thermoguttaceae bacterium]|jgi:predicted dehydrogenase|nr:Gfo/Idh/MocA family oxidoreductase [Thermoguttaceae bacterium]